MKNSRGVVLEKVVEEALSEEMTFEQRPGCRESEQSHVVSGEEPSGQVFGVTRAW